MTQKEYKENVTRQIEILKEENLESGAVRRILSDFFSEDYKRKQEILPYLTRMAKDDSISTVIKEDVQLIIDNIY